MENADIIEARKEDPHGATCGFCGAENDFADDCGWFYLRSPGSDEDLPACESCVKGPIGAQHRERFGVGER
jgi:hypothetical protein